MTTPNSSAFGAALGHFSKLAAQANTDAQDLASTTNSLEVRGEHLLAAVLSKRSSGAVQALQTMGVDVSSLSARLNRQVSPPAEEAAQTKNVAKFAAEAKHIMRSSRLLASRHSYENVGTIHILAGVFSDSNAAKILQESGASEDELLKVISERKFPD